VRLRLPLNREGRAGWWREVRVVIVVAELKHCMQ
jgi:hypothetical protein